ncbi:hypothetical protein KEJ15_07925, partial [Candidatus Bathyarchaeota archaeon]|nr:hypothetical protein [Candidatus Bathyarchaeota archaeon]
MNKSSLFLLVSLSLLGEGLSHVYNPTVKGFDVHIYVGDLVVGGNETLVFHDCTLIQNGNIYVVENATLILDNCSLNLNQSYLYQYTLEVHDNGRLICLNSSLSSNYGFMQFYDGNAMINFTDTTFEHATWTYHSGRFLHMSNCSDLGHLSVTINASFDSCAGYNALLTSEEANVLINDSQIGTVYIRAKDSTLNVSDLPENKCQPYRIGYFNTFNNLTINTGAVANLTVFNSSFSFGFEIYDSNAAFFDCYIAGLEAYGASNVSSEFYGFMQFYDGNAMINFTDTTFEHATWTYHSGRFLHMSNCSDLGHLSVTINASFDSCAGYNALLTSEEANVLINDSQIGTVYIRAKDSTLNVSDLPENKCQPYRIGYFNTFNNLTINTGAVANLTVFNSSFSFGFEIYDSNAAFFDCYIAGLEAYGASNVSIASSMIS